MKKQRRFGLAIVSLLLLVSADRTRVSAFVHHGPGARKLDYGSSSYKTRGVGPGWLDNSRVARPQTPIRLQSTRPGVPPDTTVTTTPRDVWRDGGHASSTVVGSGGVDGGKSGPHRTSETVVGLPIGADTIRSALDFSEDGSEVRSDPGRRSSGQSDGGGRGRSPGLMDSIIEARRVEDVEGFEVAYDIGGLKFVHYVGTGHNGARYPPATHNGSVFFLAGLDGSGCTLGPQLPDLVRAYDVWCLSVPADDRSPFPKLIRAVIQHLDKQRAINGNNHTILMGESFGGLLAVAVVLAMGSRAKDVVKGLFLVNPATCFENTPWQAVIPLFRNIPPSLYPAAIAPVLVTLGPDMTQFRRMLSKVLTPPGPSRIVDQASAVGDTVSELWNLIKFLTTMMPMDTLQWRISRWMQVAQSTVKPRLKEVDLPVVIAAGTRDRVFPSIQEAERLRGIMPNCTVIKLEGSGHICLDSRVNATNIISRSPKLLGPQKRGAYDPVKSWRRPSQDTINRYRRIIARGLESFTSPVFYSTDAHTGEVMQGLKGVPSASKSNPLLLVGNHQLFGVDIGLLLKGFFDDRDMVVRGLAHPALFAQPPGQEGDEVIFTEDEALLKAGFDVAVGRQKGDTGLLRNVFTTFGAVPVSARNFYNLLQQGDAVLLFPGGARENYHKRGEEYQLFWPEKSEFVRMAASANATIVPFAAVGGAESFRFLLDSGEMQRLPLLGRAVKDMSDQIPNARLTDSEEEFIAPLTLPLPPSRFYFLFGRPISTGHLKKDRKAAEQAYDEVRREVVASIDALLKARGRDQYRDFAPRMAYEAAKKERAPTFPTLLINEYVKTSRQAQGLRPYREV